MPNKNNSKKNKAKPKNKRHPHGGRRDRGGGGNAYVSTALSLTSRANARVKLSGTDRIAHVPNIAHFGDGATVLSLAITCSDIPRLSHIAEAYQRVIFHKLCFRIVPMAATTSSGGYIAGFVPDVSDDLSSGPDRLNRLVAQSGTKIAKVWQNVTVTHQCVPDNLYTSTPPRGDQRLSSPGRFVIIVDSEIPGKNDKVPVSVYLDWSVTLFEPALESQVANAPLVAPVNFYLRSNNVGLWFKDADGGDDPRIAGLNCVFDVPYRVASKRYIDFNAGEGAEEIVGNFDRVMLNHHPVHGITLFVLDFHGKIISEKPSKNQFFLEKGDTLVPEPPNVVTGRAFLSQSKSMLKRESQPRPSLSKSSSLGSVSVISEDDLPMSRKELKDYLKKLQIA